MELNLSFSQILQLIRNLPEEKKKQLQSLLSDELLKNNEGKGKPKRKAGGLKGFVTYMAKDFDAPIEDMKPYME